MNYDLKYQNRRQVIETYHKSQRLLWWCMVLAFVEVFVLFNLFSN